MLTKRYSGEFLSVNGHTVRCEIWQNGVWPEVGELTFPADEPLTLSWDDMKPESAVCGSTATLRIESPGDRTYADLYTVKPGEVRLDVYVDEALFWRGMIDPEFYEEPYSRGMRYDVELTFSDFGIADRIDWQDASMDIWSVQGVLSHVARACGLGQLSWDASMVSLIRGIEGEADSEPMTFNHGLADVGVYGVNFFDEEGEPKTCREVLDAILLPLGLQVRQRAGKLWIYDLHGLSGATAQPLVWDGDDSRLSAAPVYNNLKVTFSPYLKAAQGEAVVEDFDDEQSVRDVRIHPDYGDDYDPGGVIDEGDIDVVLHLGDSRAVARTKGGETVYPDLTSTQGYFHIEPVNGSEDSQGVVIGVKTRGTRNHTDDYMDAWGILPWQYNNNLPVSVSAKAVSIAAPSGDVEWVYSPEVGTNIGKANNGYLLRLSVDMLADFHFNPFSGSTDDNNDGKHKEITERFYANFVYMFARVRLVASDGSVWHWRNKETALRYGSKRLPLDDTLGWWYPGEPSLRDAWICWRDKINPKIGSSGIGGWKTNRQTVGGCYRKCYRSVSSRKDGQYIAYPPVGGTLTVELYAGLWCLTYPYPNNGVMPDDPQYVQALCADTGNVWIDRRDVIFWHFVKSIKTETVKSDTMGDDESEDAEYTGLANPDAREDLDLDTICGTCKEPHPSMLGHYRRLDGSPVSVFTRAGRTARPEELLIGTLFSQYAGRKNVLQGETKADFGGLHPWSEAAQDASARFWTTSESLRVREECSDITITELSPDIYISNEEE